MAVPFYPFHPAVLAMAQEIQRRGIEAPGSNPLELLKSMFEERPAIDPEAYATMAHQINDLMGIANPPGDQLRLTLMLTLPRRRGTLFTVQEMLLVEALLFPAPPCHMFAGSLAKRLDEKWDEVLSVLKSMPAPPLLLGTTKIPAERHHPAAVGTVPENVSQFLLP
jgi:hypothetical protein